MGQNDLTELVRKQHQLQVDAHDADPLTMTNEERVVFIRWNVLALENELHEMLQEVGWKPWATSRHVNEQAALRELVDAFHFLMNLALAIAPRGWDVTQITDEFVTEYLFKRLKNQKRQEDGYDGVTGKCPTCHREVDDEDR